MFIIIIHIINKYLCKNTSSTTEMKQNQCRATHFIPIVLVETRIIQARSISLRKLQMVRISFCPVTSNIKSQERYRLFLKTLHPVQMCGTRPWCSEYHYFEVPDVHVDKCVVSSRCRKEKELWVCFVSKLLPRCLEGVKGGHSGQECLK